MAPLNPQMMNPPAEKNICVFTAGPSTIQRKRKTNVCTGSVIRTCRLYQINITPKAKGLKTKIR